MGTYNATAIGAGKYAGHVTLDDHSYTATNHCATAGGKITFTNADGDRLVTMLGKGSKVCETPTPSNVHNEHLALNITDGTGVFADASGQIISDGTTTDTGPGTHADSATLKGSITLDGRHGDGGDSGDHGNGDNNDGGND